MAAQTPTKKALEPKSANTSQNSRLHAATELQSAVTPEDYPKDGRDAQVNTAAGQKRNGTGRESNR